MIHDSFFFASSQSHLLFVKDDAFSTHPYLRSSAYFWFAFLIVNLLLSSLGFDLGDGVSCFVRFMQIELIAISVLIFSRNGIHVHCDRYAPHC